MWCKVSDIKVVTICGSMRYAKQMMDIARDLEIKHGYCVIQCVYEVSPNLTKEEMENIVNAHYKKLDISDAIYIVNIAGYIGSSCKSEIEHAKSHSKEIIYHENID